MKRLVSFFTEHTPFLIWWLMFTATCVGVYFACDAGLVQRFLKVDSTHISLLIFGIFTLFTAIAGIDTYKVSKHGCSKIILKRVKTGWFFSDVLITLGMLGTVAGFIMMLEGDISAAKTALASMSKGMGIALYTTAAGVVGGLLLKVQLFNLSLCIEDSEEEAKNFCDCIDKE